MADGSLTLLASAARTASGAGSWVTGFRGAKGATFFLDVTAAATAANDTLNVYVQRRLPDGSTADDIVSFTQVLGNGGTVAFVADVIFDSQASNERAATDATLTAGTVTAVALGDALRVKWTVANGTAASFTFDVTVDTF